MVQSFLQHIAGPRLERLRQRHRVLLRACRDLHGAGRLSDLPQSVAANPLAKLDDADLSAAVAARSQSLSHATARRCRRQSGPAHRRRLADVRGLHADDRHRRLEFNRQFLFVRRYSVDPFRRGSAASVRRGFRNPRLSGVGRVDLRCRRQRDHPSDRLAASFRSTFSSNDSRPTSASISCARAKTPSRLQH